MTSDYISNDKLKDDPDPDVFKKYFKYYKSRRKTPDLSEVIDFECCEKFKKLGIQCIQLGSDLLHETEWNALGLTSPSQWKVFTINRCEGLYFISNPFTSLGQLQWVKKCVIDYLDFPNKTNLDHIPEKYEIKTKWPNLHTKERLSYLEDLRWITFGYHHNWDTKHYSLENNTPFPSDLATLSSSVAKALQFNQFTAEAAIINFYHLNSTLAGHVDHSEFDLEAPLFSFSFGQSAIFLLGGKSKSISPTPLYLRTGDIVVMAGPSRLAYHAVPKILPCEITMCMSNSLKNEMDWKISELCLQKYRININVRQVFSQNKTYKN